MPDQSSAATEHALMQEITAPLSTLPDDAVPMVADVDFPLVLRGYDRPAVDAYVKKASQLVAELQATRSPDAAIRRALVRVGEQISGILQRAHDTAAQITAQSRSEAEDRLEVARSEAAEIAAAAERRVRELDGDTDRIWAERHRIVDDAKELAGQLLALAESAAERFPAAEETGEQAVVARDPVRAPDEDLDPLRGERPEALTEAMLEPPPEATFGATPDRGGRSRRAGAPAAGEEPGSANEPEDVEATAVLPTLDEEPEPPEPAR